MATTVDHWLDENIGEVKLIKDWLKRHDIPFKEDKIEIQRNPDKTLKTIKIVLDNKALLKKYKRLKENGDVQVYPLFIEHGEAFITFTYN